MALSFLAGVPFDVLCDSTNVGIRWQKWISSFKLSLTPSGIRDAAQKRTLLLHLAMQHIFFTFENTGDEADYKGAVTKLNEDFAPPKNIPYERHVFRQAEQRQGESKDSLVSRLKKLAMTYEFGDNREAFIRDQVFDKSVSNTRRQRLVREKDLKHSGLEPPNNSACFTKTEVFWRHT